MKINVPTERHATYYNMNHKNRGFALIFNHEVFECNERRQGTLVDCESLVACLEKLGFIIRLFHDLDYADIQQKIVGASKLNHSDNDCILIVVLTHGDHGILNAKDTTYEPDILWTPFTVNKCPTLAGKN